MLAVPMILRCPCFVMERMATSPSPDGEAPASEPKLSRDRPRWLRVPSFAAAVAALFLCCVVFAVWPVIDAQYRTALYWFPIDVGLQAAEVDPFFREAGYWDQMLTITRQWDRLGSRLALLWALFALTMGSSVLVLVHLARLPTKRRVILSCFVAAMWLCLWTSHNAVLDYTVIRHARLALPRFKVAAGPLLEEWPTQEGVLSEAGNYGVVPGKYSNLIILRKRLHARYPLNEDFGVMVERSDRGTLRFDLSAAFDGKIEYHPAGTAPQSYRTWSGRNSVLLMSVQLDNDGWYFARYTDPAQNGKN
jgi:hypothetical protein